LPASSHFLLFYFFFPCAPTPFLFPLFGCVAGLAVLSFLGSPPSIVRLLSLNFSFVLFQFVFCAAVRFFRGQCAKQLPPPPVPEGPCLICFWPPPDPSIGECYCSSFSRIRVRNPPLLCLVFTFALTILEIVFCPLFFSPLGTLLDLFFPLSMFFLRTVFWWLVVEYANGCVSQPYFPLLPQNWFLFFSLSLQRWAVSFPSLSLEGINCYSSWHLPSDLFFLSSGSKQIRPRCSIWTLDAFLTWSWWSAGLERCAFPCCFYDPFVFPWFFPSSLSLSLFLS